MPNLFCTNRRERSQSKVPKAKEFDDLLSLKDFQF